jgi:anti-sigma factor RsiW
MNCSEYQQHFEAALSGQLDDRIRADLEAHLARCAACASAFAGERALWTLLGRASKIEPSHGFADRVLRQLDETPQRQSLWGTDARYWLRWALGVTTIALLCVAALGVRHHNRVEQEKRAKAEYFSELFSVAQADDPDLILMSTPILSNGDTL